MSLEAGIELAAVARLLALAFGPPDEQALGEIRSLAEALDACAADPDLRELTDLADTDIATIACEYERLFDGKALYPPYEGSYEADPFRELRRMADIAGFYRAFGARASTDRPDHAACELEFLSFLVGNRLTASERGATEAELTCLEAENAFLAEHLGWWFPTFCRAVAEATTTPLYACAARLGERRITSELSRRGLVTEPLPRSRKSSVEPDRVECGAIGNPAPGGVP